MAGKRKTYQVGDVITVPATAEVAVRPDGVVVTVRSGGPYTLDTPGAHQVGRSTYQVDPPA